MTDLDTHRAYLALLLAVLDGECETRTGGILRTGTHPRLAERVAHHAAHKMVLAIDPEDRAEMRADIAAELLTLAAENG